MAERKIVYGYTVKIADDGRAFVDTLKGEGIEKELSTEQIFDDVLILAEKIKNQRLVEQTRAAVMMGFRDVMESIMNHERAGEIEASVEMPSDSEA